MNIRTDKKQQLIDLAAHLHEVASMEQPSAIDWKERRLELEEDAIFLETFIIHKIEVEPRYTSGNSNLAAVINSNGINDLEIKPEESTAGIPFEAPPRP